MRFKAEYKVRSMAGENVVIMQGKAGSDMTRIISLNETSLLLWNKLQGRDFEVADVAAILIEEYAIESDIATADAEAWVNKLVESGLTE
ncbi:MAG: PqqD family protein [Alistipes sp.]|nr:PqqD family protein [Alistipes sp.]